MGLLQQLFSGRVHLRHHRHLAASGTFSTPVETAPEHQDALEAVVGGRSEAGAHHECTAFLVPEPADLDQPGAVAVHIGGYRVGHLARPDGERYRRFLSASGRPGPALCDALVTGGWAREEGQGYFVLRLDLDWPLRFEEDVPLEIAA